MIKVLHYCPGFKYGGIESRLIDWYTNIDRDEIQFIVIKLNDFESDKINELVGLGGKYYSLPPFSLRFLFGFIRGIRRIIKQEKPDIVHVHNTETGFFVLLIASLCGVKTRILHARNVGFPKAKNKVIRYLLHLLAPIYATDYWACSSNASLWWFGKRRFEDSKVINNGIALCKYKPNQAIRESIRNRYGLTNKVVIGSVGRFAYEKNMSFLLEVFTRLHSFHPETALLVVGDGMQKDELQRICGKNGITDCVIFVGAVNNPQDYYQSMDIFLGTSLFEGFGTTAIEAQAAGLPTIISTGFPVSTVVTSYIKRLDLGLGVDCWVSEIIEWLKMDRSSEGIELVKKAGFDTRDVAMIIEEFYKKHRRESKNE